MDPAVRRSRLAPLLGLALALALAGLGRPVAAALAGLLAAAALAGHLLAPEPTARALAGLARGVGRAVSAVTLTAVYLLVFVPLRVIQRGDDPLRRRFDRDAASYWIPRGGRPARPDRPF
jgi:hypothetical protein